MSENFKQEELNFEESPVEQKKRRSPF